MVTKHEMGSEPLVSVMMPCFNAERTLPMALASLRAQHYENWEAVIVDDGSSDRTWELLQAFDDPRVRIERFDENRGRGAARQRCLEMASGQLLSFLDSDDWLFPNKLAQQVSLLSEHPHVTVLSGRCVIMDAQGNAVGLTGVGLDERTHFAVRALTRVGPPPFSFPPCIIRMEAAKKAGFNQAFRRSQDSDFLIRAVLGKSYAISSTPIYAYSIEAASLERTLEGYGYRIRCYRQYTERFPIRSRLEIAKTWARIGVARAAGAMGTEGRLIQRRWDRITPMAKEAYTVAQATVSKVADLSHGVP